MRRTNVISRFRTLILAVLACAAIAIFAPTFSDRMSDDPFRASTVMAYPRDMYAVTMPVRLSNAPDLVLNRGTFLTDADAFASTRFANVVLDQPVFVLNAAGQRASTAGFESSPAGGDPKTLAPVVQALASLAFDTVTIRRGTLHITTAAGDYESLTDIQAELSGARKQQVASRGSFVFRGQRVAFDATFSPPSDKKVPLRWPVKISVKGNMLEMSFDGYAQVAEDVQLSGTAALSMPSVRRLARWLGLALPNAEGLQAASIKGPFTWTRSTLAFEGAKVAVDGNEASGNLAYNLASNRPLLEGTLAFGTLDLTPYVHAARSQGFVFDRQSASWSLFDLSFPIIKYINADLRVSATKVAYNGQSFGRGSASVTVGSGKLIAEITELGLIDARASGQVTVDVNSLLPRYAVRGKIENVDAGLAGRLLLGSNAISGRGMVALEFAGQGRTPADVVRQLSGKASLTLPEGGKLALDLKTLAKSGDTADWGSLTKAQTTVQYLEAHALIQEGVAEETLLARSGPIGLEVSGRADLSEGNLDVRLLAKSNVATDRPPVSADMAGGAKMSVRGTWQGPLADMRPVESGDPR
jgi:AsmA protein